MTRDDQSRITGNDSLGNVGIYAVCESEEIERSGS